MPERLYLTSPADLPNREAWQTSDENRQFTSLSSERWGEASIAAGTDPGEAQAAAARTTDVYIGQPAT